MKVVLPEFNIVALTEGDPKKLLKHIEAMGRICYQSGDLANETSYEKFIKAIIARGHEAVLEHATVTAVITCDRGVTHEIVRHRIASYCQESTRYCNYSKGKFGSEITVIEPCYLHGGTIEYEAWLNGCHNAEKAYFAMLDAGCTAQEARAVLPNSLKTQIAVTMNIREWRHFFKLRCSPAAHPQMVEIAKLGLVEMSSYFPCLFDDIYAEVFKYD